MESQSDAGDNLVTAKEIARDYSEQELAQLEHFLIETCHQLLDCNKDKLNYELHKEETRQVIKNFAENKLSRSLVVAKRIQMDPNKTEEEANAVKEKESSEANLSQTLSNSNVQSDNSVELIFTSQVEYMAGSAQTIAFLKREMYSVLDLKSQTSDLPQSLDISADTPSQSVIAVSDLSTQLQVVNLGYVGKEQNIFELASTYMDYSFLPLFTDFKKRTSQSQDGQTSAQAQGKDLETIIKELQSLKNHLQQARQNSLIPTVELDVDPAVKKRVDQAKKEGRDCKIDEFEDLVQDPAFTKRIEQNVQTWLFDICKLTQLDHDTEKGTSLEEINFWQQMETSLNVLKDQINTDEVQMVFNVVKYMKKNFLMTKFENDNDIEVQLKKARDYNKHLKEIPVQEMMDADNLKDLTEKTQLIFKQMGKSFFSGTYPSLNNLFLLRCISQDFERRLKELIQNTPLMTMDFEKYKEFANSIIELQSVWEREAQTFRQKMQGKLPNQIKKGKNIIDVLKIYDQIKHIMLFKRIKNVTEFRREHTQLEQVIEISFREVDSDNPNRVAKGSYQEEAMNVLKDLYEQFCKTVQVFDTSAEGEELWKKAQKQYEQRTSKIEDEVTKKLKQQLEKAGENTNEMFGIFTVYHKLLDRPKIRAAITQYQSKLLGSVQNDIEKLKTRVMNEGKIDTMVNQIREFPDVSNRIVYLKQLSEKLAFYQDRVKEVLGDQWEKNNEGQSLRRECDQVQLRIQKKTEDTCLQWSAKAKNTNLNNDKERTLFKVEQQGQKCQLALNFDESLILLWKECKNMYHVLENYKIEITQAQQSNFQQNAAQPQAQATNQTQNQQFKIDLKIKFFCDEVERFYPLVLSLKQSLRTFQVTCSKVEPSIAMLVARQKYEAQETLIQGLKIKWKQDQQVRMVVLKQILPKVISFEESVNLIMQQSRVVQNLFQEIKECPTDEINNKLKKIQKIIDDFDLANASNLEVWVEQQNEQLEAILVRRLEVLLQTWISEFKNFKEEGGSMINSKLVLDIKLQNRQIMLEPSLQEARAFWYKQLHNQVQVICGLQRVEKNDSNSTVKDKSFKNILLKIGESSEHFSIKQAYKVLESIFSEAQEFYETWKSYQSLWDIEQERVFELLGDNIQSWNSFLKDIKVSRKIIYTNDDFKLFGGLEISYGNVQSKVMSKYDQLHREILTRFGTTLGGQMKEFKSQVQTARHKLEALNLDDSEDVTKFVTDVQELTRAESKWADQLERIKNGQQLLKEQRYQWPEGWLPIDMIEMEWNHFKQALKRKNDILEKETEALQNKIVAEERAVQLRIQDIEMKNANNKYKEAVQRPELASSQIKDAISYMNQLGRDIKKTVDELQRVCKAKELLNMELTDAHQLDAMEEDHNNLLELWTEIGKIWSVIDKIDSTPFPVYVKATVKEALDLKQNELREFPNKFRSYQIYDVYTTFISQYKKFNEVLDDLRDDGMKPKHWKELLGKLKIQDRSKSAIITRKEDLYLHQLWCADLLGRSKIVQDVLTQARGEKILEDFINQIKEKWTQQEVELVAYQKKCKLIKGWDDLFTIVDEHTNTISSMKMSPYFKVFEKDIEPWSKTLEQIRVIFDYWIDVQKKYVYLEGIFFGSADIKSMLSNEFNKFKNIDSEFIKLMKAVNKEPKVLEIMKINNLEKTLTNFITQLEHIQKALGDYLEKQRQNFARFYFVGDEDLLEIIGNSKEIKNIQRHFPKMFAGITTVVASKAQDDSDVLEGMRSREGEEVKFHQNVNIAEDSTIYKWLGRTEDTMQNSLAHLLNSGVQELELIDRSTQQKEFNEWICKFAAQIVLLSLQVSWSRRVELSLEAKDKDKAMLATEQNINQTLEMLAERVLHDLEPQIRKKYEQLITDLVHQGEVTRQLISAGVQSVNEFTWLYHMRFYWNAHEKNPLQKLGIKMANGQFFYGFEYLGVAEKLVQTPLTDKCYLTLTQALHWRMGGSPFGPAGTGKTESVKALGAQMGIFVLVFNCDDTFDGNAMGRIFIGLCQVGAWGCFDEFNRLEERMLSAVSQSILQIQMGLRESAKKIDLMGRDVKLNPQMGIFITMNPGYAGRSQLPDNLKQLFRQMAMTKPDKEMIARVMLYSQGFKSAQRLSGKIVSLFELCHNQLSNQSHYDFGLRALKSVLVSSGNLKRSEKAKMADPSKIDDKWEQGILIKSLCDTLIPKLIKDDCPLLDSLLAGVFPGTNYKNNREGQLKDNLHKYAPLFNLVPNENFIEKCMQLYQIQNLHHGLMMVGPTGCGKTAAWKLLLHSMEKTDNKKGDAYVVDPKAICKDDLYGKLDSTTAEWTDGVFTGILRKVIDNARGESLRRHWIIFDGDVDPEWAENLNSVLDDNKLLTLPSGERLTIPDNVRIMFEVETLKHATLATVSRCGMVWFSEDTIDSQIMYQHYLSRLQQDQFDSMGEIQEDEEKEKVQVSESTMRNRQIRKVCVDAIKVLFLHEEDFSFASRAFAYASQQEHVMVFTRMRTMEALFSLLRKGIENLIEYNESTDFPLDNSQLAAFMLKWAVFSTCWGIGGSMNLSTRTKFSNVLAEFTDVEMPPINDQIGLIDYEVRIADQKWYTWKESVPLVDIDPKQVQDADVVITTVDTNRHQLVLSSWLQEKRPFLLCGPPGSGKTMTLMATLKMCSDMEMIFINFSSQTSPQLILKTFDHYCEVKKTNTGLVMTPLQASKWLVVFCDEINLPEADKYGTQTVITFLRQITEQNGYWRSSDKQWVRLERIMFVGACNPPTDSGRVVLSDRFLRHAPLILVDFPGPESLKQIYGTFNRAMMKRIPSLKNYGDALTDAMVDFYTQSQQHFTADMQPHYIYSPRELTRWKVALNQGLESVRELEDLVRLYVHEGLRLFEDRLVYEHEKEWCNKAIDACAHRWFSNCNNLEKALERPIYFTTYMSQEYRSVEAGELKDFVEARLKQFYEEVLDVPLVVFDSVLDHILRIDRVLKQQMGHLLLVGASGVGKTTLTRFVSWINNLEVFQIKAGRNYSVYDFDEDLRKVMRNAGVEGRKICFIFDESNVLGPAFLERMNALLAGGEVPGLFDGEDYSKLIASCKEEARKKNRMLETEDEIYRQFTKDVQKNLHVAFTMNPANADFSNRSASSPALFNRCVIDWFGDWADEGLMQVAMEFTKFLDVQPSSFTKPVETPTQQLEPGQKRVDPKHELLSQCIVDMHIAVREMNLKLSKQAKKFNFITPRDFLNFIKQFVNLHAEKKGQLEELQTHLQTGINKLKQTEGSVAKLAEELKEFDAKLTESKKQVSQKMSEITESNVIVKQKKEDASKSKVELQKKQAEAKERKDYVTNKLAKAEPALIDAQNAVQGVTQNNIVEVKNFKNPPEKVKIALEPVVCLVTGGKSKPTWDQIKAAITQKNFKDQVLAFDKEQIQKATKDFIVNTYLKDEKTYDVDSFMKASQAAGPLAKWLKSIIEFADIYQEIAPMRAELDKLEKEQAEMQAGLEVLESELDELSRKLKQMELDYMQATKDLSKLEDDQKAVKAKVDKANALVRNLSGESIRWTNSSNTFKDNMACLTGDVVQAAGVLTYIGFFDHQQRQVLQDEWKEIVEKINLKYSPTLSNIEFLSKPQQRLMWVQKQLPNDELSMTNAICMTRYIRYPLVIDPSDQALKFVMDLYKDRKIQKTSFADADFMSRISEGLQYGVPILVQDVEKIDPVMNSVLNKEMKKVGGRLVIQVGDKEIACTGELTLFMFTRNADAKFTPDLCSRVTFINFTVTPSSLKNQCQNIYLKNERPDIDAKRTELLKLQGEYKEKLLKAEDDLLNSLNSAKGDILENDALIQQLEQIKKDAAEIQEKFSNSEDEIEQINIASAEYDQIALMTTRIFFSLKSMANVHYLYQYSLQQFMDMVFFVLKENPKLKEEKRPRERLLIMTQQLYLYINQSIGQGLKQEDQILFTLRLVQIKLEEDEYCKLLFEQFLKPATIMEPRLLPTSLLGGRISKSQIGALEELSATQFFPQLADNLQDEEDKWINMVELPNAESAVPEPWLKGDDVACTNKIARILKKIILIKVLRSDRLIVACHELLAQVLTEEIVRVNPVDLAEFAEPKISPKNPIMLVSSPGFDASYKVEMLAKAKNKKYTAVAMGSPEAFDLVDKAIRAATKSGQWVLLKNVHLVPAWLSEVEKKIYNTDFKGKDQLEFRLFLTMENNPKVPSTLLRTSHVLVFEPPAGIKAALIRSYAQSVTVERTDKDPIERKRLHFLVSWFNAVVQERLRYTPIGWSKVYEFNESDFRCSLDCIDEWLDSMGKGRKNVDPDKIPWDALRTLIAQSVFGGKIDNDFDNKILQSLVDQFFRPESFNQNFELFQGSVGSDEQVLSVPDECKNHKDFYQWVRDISITETPSWSGLPNNVEKIVRQRQANRLITNIKLIQGTDDEIETESKDEGANWLTQLQKKVEQMLDRLPGQLDLLTRDEKSIQNPLFRFLEREVTVTSNLLDSVKADLLAVLELTKGERKQTNVLKQLCEDLHQEQIPKQWRRYTVANIPTTAWIIDFVKRVEQLKLLSSSKDFGQSGLWFGGLLFPEAYLTATRQFIAQQNSWSLEDVVLKFEIGLNEEQLAKNDQGFILTGFTMQGAEYSSDEDRFKMTEKISTELPAVNFKWIHADQARKETGNDQIQIPVYLNKQRAQLLTAVNIPTYGVPGFTWYQRGTALFAWSNE